LRNSPNVKANRFRLRHGLYASDDTCANNGAFCVPYLNGELNVICSDGMGWDHVSVSTPTRCPTWEEMCFIKELFFRDDEWVMQLHPAKAENISYHPFCLHLWRPQAAAIPLPPPETVGPKGATRAATR
jgi:hypothetical protein